ncbi:MAG TPA: TetR family transcriptional regulator [Solirubrobacteraceae bacterium]|nr:TetR family transcriptional regulator [Solirubrobacteraceae bacterium]
MPERAPEVDNAGSGRERILSAAYDLFSRSGIRAIGVDAITDEADVAKMTLYRNFHGKNGLALAFLELRDERWFRGWLQAETRARAASPVGRLLAIFEIFTEWFERDDFEGCSFVASLLAFDDRADPVRQACVEHLAGIRAYLCELATEAGAEEPERFAAQWHILLKGAIVSAHEGDLDAAMKARELAVLLVEREGLAELPSPVPPSGYLTTDVTGPHHVVRLAGELDVEAAATVAAVIDKRCDGPIRLDLADLDFVDVAGLRALRGTRQHPITIADPSDAVLHLIGLLGWDSDPAVELRPASGG